MSYELIPKHKSDVQFNGRIEFNSNWVIPYVENVKSEFDTRFEKIKTEYEQLIDEVYWNNIIYSIKLRFQPVIGNTYYLYKENENYFLSMISPSEWKREHVGTFKLNYTGKWIKI